MRQYEITAFYKRSNPVTKVVEPTERFLKMFANDLSTVEAEIEKQVNLDVVVGNVRYEIVVGATI